MKAHQVLATIAFVSVASTAQAEGINLSWDDCGNAGVGLKTFACDTNEGPPMVLVGSFAPPAGVDGFAQTLSQLDLRFPSGHVPDWWQFNDADPSSILYCRDTVGVEASGDSTQATGACTYTYGESPLAAYGYEVPFLTPDRAHLRVVAGQNRNLGPLAEGVEYYAVWILIHPVRSTGSGSCSGCTEPACIVLNSCELFEVPEVDPDPTMLATPLVRNFVTWQEDSIVGCPLSTPVRSATWGQVKSLYR